MNLCVDIRGISEEDYVKVYEKLLSMTENIIGEPCNFDLYVAGCKYAYIGLDSEGSYLIHWQDKDNYGDNTKVYSVEEFLAESKNTESVFCSKAVVYYTDGSTYTLKHYTGIEHDTDDDVVSVSYYIPPKQHTIEKGIVITTNGHEAKIDIDTQHLSGIVVYHSEDYFEVFSYSKLFARKFWTANVKTYRDNPRQENDVAEQKNTRPNSLKSGLPVRDNGQVGDAVKLSSDFKYPESNHNPRDMVGRITKVRTYDVTPYIYEVEWDHGHLNVYVEEDLIYA